MKKIVLSLAGVLAATAFAPEAAAVPSFARQTGMACNSCHFQSYPALTSFGRAFKIGGYTMIGAQAKVEGEHGLSLPSVLNTSLYTQLRYAKTGGTRAVGAAAGGTNDGRFDMPDEMALFVGGRGSENIGFIAELGLAGGPATLAGFKIPFVFDAGSVKLGLIPFSTNNGGAGFGLDLFGTGSNGAGRVTENGMGYGAAMYFGATNSAASSSATGVALTAANENFHVNLSPYSGVGPQAGANTKLGATYLRAAWTPSYNNWDLGIGLQNWTGKPNKQNGGTMTAAVAAAIVAGTFTGNNTMMADAEARLYIIDAQAQGEVGGMPLGIYASYGSAQSTSAAVTAAQGVLGATGSGVNVYNNGPVRKVSFGMLADLWVLPGTLGLQAGFMRADTGNYVTGLAAGGKERDNSYTVGARYKIRQNVKAGFAYTHFTGNAYGIGGGGGANSANYSNVMASNTITALAPASRGTNRWTLILSAGF